MGSGTDKECERLRKEAIKVIGIADRKREKEIQEEVYLRMTETCPSPIFPLLCNTHQWLTHGPTKKYCRACGEERERVWARNL